MEVFSAASLFYLMNSQKFPQKVFQTPFLNDLGYFLTKIFHPNVSEKGEICVNILKKDWNPAQWQLSSIFEVDRGVSLTRDRLSVAC